MITASRLEIARECPGFSALPHVDTPTPDTEDGRVRHAVQQAEIEAGVVPSALLERWPDLAESWRAEVKFAIDLVTGEGRELGIGTDRDYSDARGEVFTICGTADAIAIGDDVVVVVDKKRFNPDVTRPAQNAQLHIAALALCRAHKKERAEVAILHEVRGLEVAELDVLDLDTFAAEAKQILEDATRARWAARNGDQLPLREGPWCRWCPAFAACPKKLALKKEVDAHPIVVSPDAPMLPFRDDDDAANAYEFADRVRMLLKRLDAALYARAAERPIPLRSGKLFGKVVKEGNEKLDGATVYAVVREKHGQGIADTAVVMSATKTRLKEALDLAGVKNKAGAERAVLEEVRARGGSRRDQKETIDEYDPPAAQLAAGGKL